MNADMISHILEMLQAIAIAIFGFITWKNTKSGDPK